MQCFVYNYIPQTSYGINTCVLIQPDLTNKCDEIMNNIIKTHFPTQQILQDLERMVKVDPPAQRIFDNDPFLARDMLDQRILWLILQQQLQQQQLQTYTRPYDESPYFYDAIRGIYRLFGGAKFLGRVNPNDQLSFYANGQKYYIQSPKLIYVKKNNMPIPITLYIICNLIDNSNCVGKIYKIASKIPLENDPIFCQNLRNQLEIN